MTILEREGVLLIADALEGMPFADSDGCVITSEPSDEAWGDRVFELIDPLGYQWEISQRIAEINSEDALRAVQAEWSAAREGLS